MAVLIFVRSSVYVLLLLKFGGCATPGETDTKPVFNRDFDVNDYICKSRKYEYDAL